jgi:hypothetical protein
MRGVAEPPLTPDDERHGTIRGYTTHRCRCEPCKAAWATYHRDYRAQRKAAKKLAVLADALAARDALAEREAAL